jgi:hypothetical protein
MAHLEGAYEQISERLGGIDGRLTALDQKIDSRFDTLDRKMDGKLEAIDRRFDAFDKKVTGFAVASLSTSAATLAAVVGAIIAVHR